MTGDKRSSGTSERSASLLRSATSRTLLLWGTLAIPVAMAMLQVPGAPRLAQALQNSGHIPAFALFAWGVTEALKQLGRKTITSQTVLFATTFLGCMIVGVGVEIAQASTGRVFSVPDLASDAVGALGGLAALAYWQLQPSDRVSRAGAKALLVVCAACLLLATIPVAYSLAAYANRNARFPVLWEYQSDLDLYFVNIVGGGLAPLAAGHEGATSQRGRRVVFDDDIPGNWPGFQLDEPLESWQQFRWLMVDIENPESERLDLQVRVHDSKFRNQAGDLYLERLSVAARERKVVRIALEEVAASPHERRLDLGKVSGVVIFGDRRLAGRAFILRRIWLE